MTHSMKQLIASRKLLPIVIFVALLAIAWGIFSNPPQTARKPVDNSPRISVEILTVQPVDYQVQLSSYGTVQPRTRTMLVAQVGGMVNWINPNFRDGGFFKQGEVLLKLDPRDYQADTQIAEASLLDARQLLAEEQARSAQAAEDWQRLGNEGEAPDLVLRKPQLLAAQAQLKSAEAALIKARLSLERTEIKAPYDGRILNKQVDMGQVVGANSAVADIYASDYVEVRLPISNWDLGFIDLPEAAAGTTSGQSDEGAAVAIKSSLADDRLWHGRLVRTEGAIDESARQLHVIAQIDDPFGRQAGTDTPIKIGEYVTASITGKRLANALVIPNSTIYQGSYVYLVKDGVLQRQNITISWQNQSEAIIGDGISAGDMLVVTPLGQVTSGIRVSIINSEEQQQPASKSTTIEAANP